MRAPAPYLISTVYPHTCMMGFNKITNEEYTHHKEDPRGLRRVFSDTTCESEKSMATKDTEAAAEQVECECCGMLEECTQAYISSIKEFYCGRWVCGLCSVAMKEEMKRRPMMSMEAVMESHMAFCKTFNRTTKVNPKLSLAGTMRDIARRSSQHRSSKGLFASKIAASAPSSCRPGIGVRVERSPIR